MLMPYLAAHLSGTLGLAGWLVGLDPRRTQLQPAGHVPGRRNAGRPARLQADDRRRDACCAPSASRPSGWSTRCPRCSPPQRRPGWPAHCSTRPSGPTWRRTRASAGSRRSRCSTSSTRPASCSARWSGMVLTGVDFRITCLVSAGIFAVLSVVQIRALPARRADDAKRQDGGVGQRCARAVARHPRQPAVPAVLRRHDRFVRPVLPGLPGPAAGGTAAGRRRGVRHGGGGGALRRLRAEHDPRPDHG